ncbi:MAG TPA: PIG-L deacetylase family protein [Anaerolineales bacterium]|nr:PIG-L deacetylase family protein [Anaerolineales bacterium]
MNILPFFAHPDDETILTGGTLALLAKHGAQVHYLCATRGEGGEVGDPPVCAAEELGAVREAELVCAVGKLGGRSLTFLGYEDPRVGPDEALYAFTDDLTGLAGQVAATVRQFDIDAILTHGSNGEYGHPAHVLCHQAALVAAMSFPEGEQPAVYTFSAFFDDHPYPRLLNKDDPADLVIDVSGVRTQKLAAALCHKTQHALFVRRRSEEVGRRLTVEDVIIETESLGRAFGISARLEKVLRMGE